VLDVQILALSFYLHVIYHQATFLRADHKIYVVVKLEINHLQAVVHRFILSARVRLVDELL
jgi:hypothetical protein